ncbi:type IV secretory system conjugative DNA transfer family protein [Kribbella speibonae]|uniref:Type IV secretory system conjugative DNA transfer family protein n=1 Tax=Kribbella speibonae TaxID=1572660 RepID=A0ABY2AAA1_9ACTN|nr:DUF87 domain-containing protein [Kribbella speibonae]TCC25392.1 type IV secretory system conjugative DNA transfer family protein [Kribbella speibonae]
MQPGDSSGNDFDLVGFSITPSRALTTGEKQKLELDIASLLSSVAFPPPGIEDLAFDLRYLAISDKSLTGKQLIVVLLCRLNYAPEVADRKQTSSSFRREFSELLSLHLEEYDYRIVTIPAGDIWRYLKPFETVDYVELLRRVTNLRPLRMAKFQGQSPMSRAVDMLLRQPSQICLSVHLEPHPMSESESRELELYGYETDVLPSDDRDLKDFRALLSEVDVGQRGTSTPFRIAIRIASDAAISQYVINLLGAEMSGRRDYSYYRPPEDKLEAAAEAMADLRFFSTEDDAKTSGLPESLRNLRHIFAVAEAQTAFRLPTERIATSRERTFRTYQAPVANLPREGLLLGTAEHPSYQEPLPVYLKTSDRRRHMYVVGKTGTGKSMLLLNTIAQDLNNGAGLCLVDPHGDLTQAVLQHIPRDRAEDLVIFDPADRQRVAGLNFLQATANGDDSEKDYLTQEIISMILRMVDYDIGMYGPIAQQMTRVACRTLMALDTPATLLEVPRLFSNPKFRAGVLRHIKDEELKNWWTNEWEAKTEYQKNEVLGYFTSKFEQFISAPAVRRVVGQAESSFDFKQIMDEGRILLVNLSRGRLGALNSSALGHMIVSKILWAATRRAWEPEASRRDFYLYVDEFQNFVSDSFDTILSEARKYRLNLIVAHQHLGQLHAMGRLGDRVERAVFGNAGTLITFRVGTDGGRIADELGTPADAGTLRSLQNRFCVAQLLVDDVPTTPFTMKTIDYSEPAQKDSTAGWLFEQARSKNPEVIDINAAIATRWSEMEA